MTVEISAFPDQGAYTFQDAIEHLTMFSAENSSRRFRSDIVNSVNQAYEEIGSIHDWQYFLGHLRIKIPASINQLVDYTNGMGTYRAREMSSATAFPDWIRYARAKDPSGGSSGIVYEVDDELEQSPSHIVTLTADKNPGEDRTGETWTLYQNRFPLPRGFRRMSAPFSAESWGAARKAPLEEMVWKERYNFYSGSTRTFTIAGNTDETGGMFLIIDPPEPEETVDFVYTRAPRRLKLTGQTFPQRGTDATAGGMGITMPSANLIPDMVGAVVRLASTTSFPTGIWGDNPYSEQRIITTVKSTTEALVNRPWDGTYSTDTGYAITDPIDLPYACRDAFWRCCEYKIGIMRQFQNQPMLFQTWMQSLRLAKERDSYDSRRRWAKGWPDTAGYFADWRVDM